MFTLEIGMIAQVSVDSRKMGGIRAMKNMCIPWSPITIYADGANLRAGDVTLAASLVISAAAPQG
jgi:hypothetical protein